MIRNRLASILADRGIKISRAAMELPDLSRNTITNTASNTGKMIQLETIDKLCQYLNITPNDFFEYLPFDLDYTADISTNNASTTEEFSSINVKGGDVQFDFYIKQTYANGRPFKLFSFTGKLEKTPSYISNIPGSELYYFSLTSDNKNEFKPLWENQLTSGFRPIVWNNIKSCIAQSVNKSMYDIFSESPLEEESKFFLSDDGSNIALKTDFNSDVGYKDIGKIPF